ncbi:AI-2E family transporter [Euzebya tangerina]|uniref:AI-2E family transporter n=1 Tax=Euzebya tangerina TaxID=591198 RepID=UPI0013C2F767|nr:AI-2E family transporter [Euzebya tangerina]
MPDEPDVEQPDVPREPSPSPADVHATERALPSPARVLGLIAVVVVAYGTILMIQSLRSILVMLLVSLFISFAMEPAVKWLVQRGARRGFATAAVFLLSILLLVASFGSVIPLLIDQVGELLRSLPRSVSDVNDLLSRIPLIELQLDPEGDLNQELLRIGREFGTGDLASVATGNVLGAAGSVVGLGATAIGILFQGLTVLLVSFYMVADGPRFRATLARPLPPQRQRELLAVWEIAVAKTGGYIYSRLLLAITAALVTAIFLTVLGVPYPLPLGLWVGVSGAFIPVLGTYLGGILVLLVAAGDRPLNAAWVLVFLIVYQQLENYLIAPRLTAVTMDVHPAVAFVSVIIGATLLGAVGALLALPATAIIQAVASTYIHRHQLIDELIEASESLEDAVGPDLPPLRVDSIPT